MSYLLTFRHLREIKSVQGKFCYYKKEKESNEGDFDLNDFIYVIFKITLVIVKEKHDKKEQYDKK